METKIIERGVSVCWVGRSLHTIYYAHTVAAVVSLSFSLYMGFCFVFLMGQLLTAWPPLPFSLLPFSYFPNFVMGRFCWGEVVAKARGTFLMFLFSSPNNLVIRLLQESE